MGGFLGVGAGGAPPPPPWDDLRFSNTTGILPKKKTMWFIGVEVEQETSATPPKKNPGSAPEISPKFTHVTDRLVISYCTLPENVYLRSEDFEY